MKIKTLIEALRSGKYKKNETFNLRDGDGFSVLGVMCDLYNPHGWKLTGDVWTYSGWKTILPPDVQLWAGCNMQGEFIHPEKVDLTKTLNLSWEEQAQSFEQLANTIQRYFEMVEEQKTLFK